MCCGCKTPARRRCIGRTGGDPLCSFLRVDTDARLTGGGVDVQLRPGAVAFLPANVDYQRRATHDELIVIHFDILNFSAGQIDCFYPDDPEDICRRFEEIHALWQRNAPGARYRAAGALL